ncbi:MAG TPA: phosphotransferase, partial [Rhizomicrobium sp.]
MNADFLSDLNRALARAIPGFERVETITRLSGGASQETWSFDALIHGAREPLILRRAPGGERTTESASAVPLETEAVVIEAARAAGVAAPRVRYVLKFEDNVGHGYVMDRLPGETIARKILR